MRVAVLITSYNRVGTTLRCLQDLYSCTTPLGYQFDIYLVDDGSPDHTGQQVSLNFPSVEVIGGHGGLYWCGGMRLAWETAAIHADYDAYLWLNDDTFLYADALVVLAASAQEAAQRKGDAGILVGAVCDPVTGQPTYGFSGDSPRAPEGTLLRLRDETINGNTVWVSRKTWQRLGNLRSCFTHSMGDTDYGVRAQKAGIPVWLAPKYAGTCPANVGTRWDDADLSIAMRWKMLHAPKGCPPREFAQLVRMDHPWTWLLYVCKLYWRVLFPQ